MSYSYVKPLAIRRALYHSMDPLDRVLTLNTHLQPTTDLSGGRLTRSQVRFLDNASSFSIIAACHKGLEEASR